MILYIPYYSAHSFGPNRNIDRRSFGAVRHPHMATAAGCAAATGICDSRGAGPRGCRWEAGRMARWEPGRSQRLWYSHKPLSYCWGIWEIVFGTTFPRERRIQPRVHYPADSQLSAPLQALMPQCDKKAKRAHKKLLQQDEDMGRTCAMKRARELP